MFEALGSSLTWILVSVKWEGFIKIINAYTHTQTHTHTHTERERIRKSWKEFMKATFQIPNLNFLVGRFPL